MSLFDKKRGAPFYQKRRALFDQKRGAFLDQNRGAYFDQNGGATFGQLRLRLGIIRCHHFCTPRGLIQTYIIGSAILKRVSTIGAPIATKKWSPMDEDAARNYTKNAPLFWSKSAPRF